MLNNIKSRYILEMIFQILKHKRKLKIIKTNKKMLEKLQITIKDFQVYETLKKFNEKYSTNIEDLDIKEINLSDKKIGDEGLKFLCEIKFIN